MAQQPDPPNNPFDKLLEMGFDQLKGPSEHVGALALALVKHSWSGSIDAVSELKELYQANGINAEEHSY